MERRKAFVVAGAVTLSAFAGASALGAATGLLGFGGTGTAEPAAAGTSAPGTETRIVHLPGRIPSTTTPPQSTGRTAALAPSSGPIPGPTPVPVPVPTSVADSGVAPAAPAVNVSAPSAPAAVVVTPTSPVPVSGASPRTTTPPESESHEVEHESPTHDLEHSPEAEHPEPTESGD